MYKIEPITHSQMWKIIGWVNAEYGTDKVSQWMRDPPKCWQNSSKRMWYNHTEIHKNGTISRGSDIIAVWFREESDYLFWKLKL